MSWIFMRRTPFALDGVFRVLPFVSASPAHTITGAIVGVGAARRFGGSAPRFRVRNPRHPGKLSG